MIRRMRAALKEAADTSRAPGMQDDMKSSMPYHGVSSPVLRKVFREVFSGVAFADAEEWRTLVLHVCGVWIVAGHDTMQTYV